MITSQKNEHITKKTIFFSISQDLLGWYSLGDGGGFDPASLGVTFDPLPPGDNGLNPVTRFTLLLIDERNFPSVPITLVGDFPLLSRDTLSSSGCSVGLSVVSDIMTVRWHATVGCQNKPALKKTGGDVTTLLCQDMHVWNGSKCVFFRDCTSQPAGAGGALLFTDNISYAVYVNTAREQNMLRVCCNSSYTAHRAGGVISTGDLPLTFIVANFLFEQPRLIFPRAVSLRLHTGVN